MSTLELPSVPNTHAISLSVDEMKAIDLAVHRVALSRSTFLPALLQQWERLHERFQSLIPKCEQIDRERGFK